MHSRLRTNVLRAVVAGWCGMLAAVLPVQTAVSQSTIVRGWQLDADGALKIHADAGSVQVIAWDRDSVAVSGTVPDNGTFFGGGGHAGVKFGIDSKDGKPAVSDLIVHVPARARVWIRSVTSDIEVSGFSGALDASTVAGRVRVQGSPVEVRAETMNGALEVNASTPYLRLKTATGNITWNGSSDDAGITTVSGRVVITAGTVQRGRFESIDGDIRFSGSMSRNGGVAIDTHSGNVVLALKKGTSAALEVSAPWCELFGVKEGQERKAGAVPIPKTYYRTIGQPTLAGQTLVVRTYKGFVSAVMQ